MAHGGRTAMLFSLATSESISMSPNSFLSHTHL